MNRFGRSALPSGSCKNRSYGAHPRSTVCPCCDLADDLQPQILCIVWLAGDIILPKLTSPSIGHRTTKLGLEQLDGSAPMWREINEKRVEAFRVTTSTNSRDTARSGHPPKSGTPYQRTAFPGERYFVICILPHPRDLQCLQPRADQARTAPGDVFASVQLTLCIKYTCIESHSDGGPTGGGTRAARWLV